VSILMKNVIFVSICGLMGLAGVQFIRKYGNKLGIVDVPNERSSHNNVIPKGGGIGILAAFVLCAFMLGFSKTFWLSSLVLSLVSFVGDRLAIKPKDRLVVHFGCGLVFLIGVMAVYDTHVWMFLLFIPLCVFIVGTANFYNFMDGIDGIAGITGVVGFLLLAFYGYGSGADSRYIVLAVSMAFACAGFLPFNLPKAKVFMGDVGSVLLGFVFACMVILLSRTPLDFICMTSFLFPFYADELTTMVVRIREGDRLTEPHRKHVYQLLANEYGIDHWKVSLGYGSLQLFIGCGSCMLRGKGYLALLSFLAGCLIWFCVLSVYVRLRLKYSTTNSPALNRFGISVF
jgi:Fuc2NAc and GlcNAc transferase